MLLSIAFTILGLSFISFVIAKFFLSGVNQLGFINENLWTEKEAIIVIWFSLSCIGIWLGIILVVLNLLLKIWL